MKNGHQSVPQVWPNPLTSFFLNPLKLVEAQCEAGKQVFESMFGIATSPRKVEETPRARGPEVKPPDEKKPAAKEPPRQPAPAQKTATSFLTEGCSVGPKRIQGKVALVTGAASGIGEAVVRQFATLGARAVILVDVNDRINDIAGSLNDAMGKKSAVAIVGDTTDEQFRVGVFDEVIAKHGVVNICVPAAGITRDRLSVKIDKSTGEADIYPVENFRKVTEVNLIAPIYWALEMVARIATDRWQRGKTRWDPEEGIQGTIVLIGSVSSQGNKGQISYAVAKAGLEGAAATLTKEAIFHGVRCGVIHPGFTDTPMVRALGEDYINKNILPYTQLRRLIKPEEIADAICFMVSNSAVSGELWADAGWHPPA
jgi:NAD(P)-dependent dehydrogenase (short-subunit alcohol dehydrogenase family)